RIDRCPDAGRRHRPAPPTQSPSGRCRDRAWDRPLAAQRPFCSRRNFLPLRTPANRATTTPSPRFSSSIILPRHHAHERFVLSIRTQVRAGALELTSARALNESMRYLLALLLWVGCADGDSGGMGGAGGSSGSGGHHPPPTPPPPPPNDIKFD